jgi:hypothetical protein
MGRQLQRQLPQATPSLNTDAPSLTILRTDTVFAKLPIHNLAKRGLLSIHISESNRKGLQDLYWHVSPSTTHGPPQQLAYKLDTLLINRRLDALKRPLPTVIRLGSLRHICDELGLRAGKSITEIKNAFHQNAGAYITAKLRYRDREGKTRRLEAGFNRYGVIFTGESLPDGVAANAVYIVLNESYRQVLNSAPTRPVDYDYLSDLKPLAQRFYELLSFKMYAALKYQQSVVSMRYSELCLYAPQHRYLNRTQMSKQMYKVHHPHLQSGYLTKVSTESVLDGEGRLDWMLQYTPGPKAQAEYQAFTGQPRRDQPSLQVRAGTDEPEDVVCDGPGAESLDPTHVDLRTTPATALVQHFYQLRHDITDKTPHAKEIQHATRLIAAHGQDFATFFVQFACQRARQKDFTPEVFGGLMRYEALALAAYRRQQSQQERRHAEEAETQAAYLRQQYERDCQTRVVSYRAGLSSERLARLEEEVRTELAEREEIHPSVFGARLKAELHHRLLIGAGVPSFNDWREQRGATSQDPTTPPQPKGGPSDN